MHGHGDIFRHQVLKRFPKALFFRLAQQHDMVQPVLQQGVHIFFVLNFSPSVSKPHTIPRSSAHVINSARSSRSVGSPPVKMTCGMPASIARSQDLLPFSGAEVLARRDRWAQLLPSVPPLNLIGNRAVQAVGRGNIL